MCLCPSLFMITLTLLNASLLIFIFWIFNCLATSVHNFSKHFGLSLAYYAPKIWNDLLNDICLATTYLFAKVYPPQFLALYMIFCTAPDPCYVWLYGYGFLFFLYYAPIVCLLMEIKFYKSTIRIGIIIFGVIEQILSKYP